MKFCKKCGHQLKDEANVCSQCGKAVQKTTNQTKEQTKRQTQRKDSSTLSKKQKLTMLVSAGVLVAAFSAYQVVTSIFDQHRAVDQFEEALIERDTERLAAMVTSSDPSMEIEPEDLQGLVQYVEGNSSFINDEMASLRQQAESMDHEVEEVVANPADNSLFQLKPDGNNWIIFDAYSFEVRPFYVNITTNEADTVIYLDEEEIAIAEEDDLSEEFGPFPPGIYTVKAELGHDYAALEREEELTLIEAPQDQIQVDLTLNGEYIHIDSNEPEADVYVNGDAIDLTVEQVGQEFGPVITDGSMTIHAEHDYPWGTASSEEEEITGTNISLDVPIATNELKEQLMDMVNENVDSLDEDVEDIDYDLDSFSVENIEDQYTATFDAIIHYDSDGSNSDSHQAFTAVYDMEDEEWLMDEDVELAEGAADEEEEQETTTNDNSLRVEYIERANNLEDEIMREAQELYEHDTEPGFAGQYYDEWDDLLNEVWGELEDTMPSDAFEPLRSEQLEWIEMKEQNFADMPDEAASARASGMDYLANETKDRTYYLIENYMD